MNGIAPNYTWHTLVELPLEFDHDPERAARAAWEVAEMVTGHLSSMASPFPEGTPGTSGPNSDARESSLVRLKAAFVERFSETSERAGRDVPPLPALVRVLVEMKDQLFEGSWGFFLVEKGPCQIFPQRTLEVYLYFEGDKVGV